MDKKLLAEHKTRAPHAGANARLHLLLENYKSKKGHNFVKKILRVTCPTGMGSPFDSKNYCEFQLNIFSNDRDIRKCQSF